MTYTGHNIQMNDLQPHAGSLVEVPGLRYTDANLQTAFNAALKETSISGRNTNLLLHAPDERRGKSGRK